MKKRHMREKRGLTFIIRGVFLLFVLIGSLSVLAENGNAQTEIPSFDQLTRLTQTTMHNFALALKTRDFTAFYTNIAKIWQEETTAEALASAFRSFSDQDIDLTGLRDLEPVFLEEAVIDGNGWLILQGYYPTQPSALYFLLKYLHEGSAWKLVGINIDLKEETLPESSEQSLPEEQELKQLTQDTLLDFALAVKAKDFTKFYLNISKLWQAQTTKEELAKVFQLFFDQNIDFTIIQHVDPILSEAPQINEQGVLILQGYYPAQSMIINFTLKYFEEDSAWKLIGINLNPQEESLSEHEKTTEETTQEESPTSQATQEAEEWERLNKKALALYDQKQYLEALQTEQEALNIAQKVFGSDHPNVADSLFNMAMYHQALNQYDQAEGFHKGVLSIMEKVYGEDSLEAAESLYELAYLYDIQEKYADAEAMYQRVLEIRTAVLGADHPDVTQILNRLGLLHEFQQQYDKAESYYTQALEIRRQVAEDAQRDVAVSAYNLAVLYHTQQEYNKAESLYKRSLAIEENILGPDHLDITFTLSKLGKLYQALEQYVDAEPFLRRAINIRIQLLGSESSAVAESLNDLGEWYALQDKNTEAELLYLRALEILDASGESEGSRVVTTLENLIELYKKIGKEEKATKFEARLSTIHTEH